MKPIKARASVGMRYITWGDYTAWTGYMVRLPKPSGTIKTKLFSVANYKTKAATLTAAIEYRDEEFRKLWGRSILNQPVRDLNKIGKKNTSGKTGVFFMADTRSGSRDAGSWVAASPKGAHTQFSVRKYGKIGAFELARLARSIFVKLHQG